MGNRIRTLDLRELAKELDDLRERATTCEHCGCAVTIAEDGKVTHDDADDDDKEHSPAVDYDDEARERVKAIEEIESDLAADLGSYAKDEAMAIRKEDFAEYAEELADDLGSIPKGAGWPLTCIDWQKAADELEYDYSGFTFDGDEYLVRSR